MEMSIDESMLYEMGYNKGFKDGIKSSIPKADYEARLKADMADMLTEILTDFDNLIEPNSTRIDCESIIEQKIQALEGKSDGEK